MMTLRHIRGWIFQHGEFWAVDATTGFQVSVALGKLEHAYLVAGNKGLNVNLWGRNKIQGGSLLSSRVDVFGTEHLQTAFGNKMGT